MEAGSTRKTNSMIYGGDFGSCLEELGSGTETSHVGNQSCISNGVLVRTLDSRFWWGSLVNSTLLLCAYCHTLKLGRRYVHDSMGEDNTSSVLGIFWTLPYVLLSLTDFNLPYNHQINQVILILLKSQQHKLILKCTWNSKEPRITKTLLEKKGSCIIKYQDLV